MNIVFGITGGIAAYKACDLINIFKRDGHSVDVIMTKSAQEFITPLTIQTLSKSKVNLDMFEQVDIVRPEHISLADRADLFVIYPATGNIIGKIANGIADDLLSTVAMAVGGRDKSDCRRVLCPAMNNNMWNNSIVQSNVKKLSELGYDILGPVEGMLACGDRAIGCVMKPMDVYRELGE